MNDDDESPVPVLRGGQGRWVEGSLEVEEGESVVWADRTKRVLVYTASLLFAPMLAMPYSKGSREFFLAVMGWAAIMILSSAYLLHGELKLKSRSLLGYKLLATSLITLLFSVSVLVGCIVHLSTRSNG